MIKPKSLQLSSIKKLIEPAFYRSVKRPLPYRKTSSWLLSTLLLGILGSTLKPNVAQAAVLVWGDVIWPDNSKSQTYFVNGVNVTIELTETTPGILSRIDNKIQTDQITGGFPPPLNGGIDGNRINNLTILMDPNNISDFVTLTISFDKPIENLRYVFLDIDRSQTPGSSNPTINWNDQVTVFGNLESVPVVPTINLNPDGGTVNAGGTGTTFFGVKTGVQNNTSGGNVQVDFPSAVNEFIARFENGPNSKANPDRHGFGLFDITFRPIIIGAAKRVTSVQDLGNGTYDVTYTIVIQNLGETDLSNVQATENLTTTFAAATNYTVKSISSSTFTVNSSFNGVGNLLAANQTLSVGQSKAITLVVNVEPGNNLGPYNNQVTASGRSPTGAVVSDKSDNGPNPDPNGNKSPDEEGENDPTPVSFNTIVQPVPRIGVAKSAGTPVALSGGQFRIPYTIQVTNYGETILNNVQVVEDLQQTFTNAAGFSISNLTSPTTGITVNGSFNGTNNQNLLASGNSLAIGSSAVINFDVIVTPGTGANGYGPFNNTAIAQGTDPNNTQVTDNSQNGVNPDPDGNGNPNDNQSPTIVTIQPTPQLGVAKSAGNPVALNDGTFRIPYTIRITNTGNTPLNNLTLEEDLKPTFATATDFVVQNLATPTNGLTLNSTFDGDSDTEVLAATGNSLAIGQTAVVTFEVIVTPGSNPVTGYGPFDNTAIARATSPTNQSVNDTSTNGNNVDPDNNNNPNDNSTPTTVSLTPNPQLGVAKMAGTPVLISPQRYRIPYMIRVTNTGNTVLTGLQVVEDLAATFQNASTTPPFTVTDLSVGSGSSPITLNNSFNGTTNQNLLTGVDTLAIGATAIITFNVEVTPGNGPNGTGPYNNNAVANATGPNNQTVTDTSTNGTDPDPDQDNDPTNNGTPTTAKIALDPKIGVAKEAGTPVALPGGKFSVPYTISVKNSGNAALDNVQVVENLNTTFANADGFQVIGIEKLPASTAPNIEVNPAFNGKDNTNLLEGGNASTLGVGEEAVIEFTVEVTPGPGVGGYGPFNNNVVASAVGPDPDNPAVNDTSTNGKNVDPDNDGNPGNNETPTTVSLTPNPQLGVAKAAGTPQALANGQFRIPYTVLVKNTGNVDLINLQLVENLTTTFAQAQDFSVENITPVTNGLFVNSNFNGKDSTNLLAPGNNLVVGQSAILTFNVLVTPGAGAGGLGPFNNTVEGSAQDPNNNPVTDTSTNGQNVDPDNDQNPGNNSVPTAVQLNAGATQLYLIKRITGVTRNGVLLEGINFNTFVDDPSDPNDNVPGWAQLSPVGVTTIPDSLPLQSGDEVEYSVYFLATGGPIQNFRVCDSIPQGTTFLPDSFGGNQGISLKRGAANPVALTNSFDGDVGAYFSPLAPIQPANVVCPVPNNERGAVTIANFGTLSNQAGENYGYVRFRVRVD